MFAMRNNSQRIYKEDVSIKKQNEVMETIINCSIVELYSPPRVSTIASKYGITSLGAFDITEMDPDDNMPWDLNLKSKRDKIRHIIKSCKPTIVIGSPMCTAFSSLQNMNVKSQGTDEWKAKMKEAISHMKFACEIYEVQISEGRYCLHEHPLSAKSWALECIQKIKACKGVATVRGDQCMMGLVTKGPGGEDAKAMKPTRFMSNSKCILERLECRCDGTHEHQPLTQGRAEAAARYPKKMCDIIVEGIKEQMKADMDDVNEVINMIMEGTHDKGEEYEQLWTLKKGQFIDDVHGTPLNEKKVMEARGKEMEYFRKMKVYVKTTLKECWDQTGQAPIMVRWVDTDKNCDPNDPNYRSRLVAMQFKVHGDRPDLYSPTPPLEALKVMLALLASSRHADKEWDDHIEDGPVEAVHSDVSRAYFNAPVTEPTYVRIPDEDWQEGDEGKCARLLVSMYGTRKAASNWETHYSSWLEEMGFERGTAYPSIFVHEKRNMKLMVHGDDFLTIGRKRNIEWFIKNMNIKYESKHVRMGEAPELKKSLKILNRIVTWETESISIEADTRHVETAMRDLKLTEAHGVCTPAVREQVDKRFDEEGEKVKEVVVGKQKISLQSDGRPITNMASKKLQEAVDEEELEGEEATLYRSVVARFNYLAPDRPDIQFAVRDCAKCMAKPKRGDLPRLKRIGRYLLVHKRVKVHMWVQPMPATIHVHTDSDWAGCKRTRLSVSGGVVRLGAAVVRTWSKDQGNLATSSAEAELYAANLGGQQALGLQTLLAELAHKMNIVVHVDSSAAIGVLQRKGIGKIRHLDVADLWMQTAIQKGRLDVAKIDGAWNDADIATKPLTNQGIMAIMERIGAEFMWEK